jgi:hypothetical protein
MLIRNLTQLVLVLLLLLVRQWDPATGKLRVHLPMHNVDLQLQCVDKRLPAPEFEAGEVLEGTLRQDNVIELRKQVGRTRLAAGRLPGRNFEIKAITFQGGR